MSTFNLVDMKNILFILIASMVLSFEMNDKAFSAGILKIHGTGVGLTSQKISLISQKVQHAVALRVRISEDFMITD